MAAEQTTVHNNNNEQAVGKCLVGIHMRIRVMRYWEFFPDQLQTQYKRCIGPPRSQM